MVVWIAGERTKRSRRPLAAKWAIADLRQIVS
jgi:hypothetical protein